ncbi:MAG: hypothetical protein KBC58_09775 [Flavobacterium sp.]|nr:hypothetical protein [Flavobacterium sp.]
MKYLFTILFIFPIITFSQVGSTGTYGTTNGVNGPNFGSMTSNALKKMPKIELTMNKLKTKIYQFFKI